MSIKQDLPQTSQYITWYNRYQVLYLQVSKSPSDLTELSILQTNLANYLISASEFNALASQNSLTTVDNKIGNLPSLSTTNKSTLVAAINEINNAVLNNQVIYSLEREVANLKAASSIANRVDGSSAYLFDLNDGLNAGSIGLIDMTKTNSTSAITASGTTKVVPVTGGTTGFVVGQEVTIMDATHLERRNITAISAGVSLTFAAMTNSFSAKALICRSSVVQDTINHLLKFNGWSFGTTFTNSAVTIVGAAYDTSGNNGRKVVKTANGWLIALELNGTTIQVQKSTDGGVTWAALCIITGAQVGAAIECINGNNVTVVWNSTTVVYSNTFDVTTVTNTDQNGSKVTIDNALTSVANNISLKVGIDGIPVASWCGIHPSFPNSKNPRYSKATTTSVTAWATPTQIDTINTTGNDSTNPCIIVKSNNNPIIVVQYLTGTTYSIKNYVWNGTVWSSAISIYSVATYSQLNPSTSISPNGRIWVAWDGLDSTDTSARNIRVSYSDDGGLTWSAMDKRTSGNTYSQSLPSISIDKNNIATIMFQGIDSTINTTYTQIRRLVYSGSWGSTSSITSNSTNHATIPASIDNNTLDYGSVTPPTIYKDAQATAIKYSGNFTSVTATSVLVEDVRYNIIPPANINSAIAWVQRETDANFSMAGAASFQANGGNESYISMTKTSAAIDGSTSEDQFVCSGTSAARATLRLTLTRNSTSLVKNIKSITGAVN